jgi:hypothetical protein
LLVSPAGSYLAIRAEDRSAMYAYGGVPLIDVLWLPCLLEGAIML